VPYENWLSNQLLLLSYCFHGVIWFM